jgi:hypothetical protein
MPEAAAQSAGVARQADSPAWRDFRTCAGLISNQRRLTCEAACACEGCPFIQGSSERRVPRPYRSTPGRDSHEHRRRPYLFHAEPENARLRHRPPSPPLIATATHPLPPAARPQSGNLCPWRGLGAVAPAPPSRRGNAGHDLATIPLILLWTLAGFVAHSFTYTSAWNRTGSVVPCTVLPAAYNTAPGVIILRPEDDLVGGAYVAISLILTGLLWLTALGVIAATRGRLGLGTRPDEASPAAAAERPRTPTGPRPLAPVG